MAEENGAAGHEPLDDDSLDFVLRKYHQAEPAQPGDSVLELLTRDVGEWTPVLLREPDGPDEPVVRLDRGEGAHAHGRYQVHGELARGGVGAILKARDPDLGRDVAIKTLLERHTGNPVMLHRFIEEAQIGGQLQHPGILPVYEMGLRDDGRPYFTMKLVKGRTLAAMLDERQSSTEDLRRFLSIFEQVCQTVAYAHARAVIHRDLKPANVMIGSFGEVHVMDWGLAKVLGKGGVADERNAKRWAEHTSIETVRGDKPGSQSVTGSVMGTLSYMPPEQARGKVEGLDERSDVFSLGAILLEILTGRPPYEGESMSEVREKASQGELDDALASLAAADVDAELAQIVRSCLQTEQRSRPRDAGVVASEISSYMEAVETRARAADVAAGEARVKAVAERRARRLTLALSAACFFALLLAGGGYLWLEQQQRTRTVAATRDASAALEEARQVYGEAGSSEQDLAALDRAYASASFAEKLAGKRDVAPAIGKRVAKLLATIVARREQARRSAARVAKNRDMLAGLESVSAEFEFDYELQSRDWSRRDRAYAACFAEYGVDFERMSRRDAVTKIRDSGIATELASALDEWAFARKLADKNSERWKELREAARDADADPFRRSLREASLADDRERLRSLAESAQVASSPSGTWVLLGRVLDEGGETAAALAVLRRGQAAHPEIFDINHRLGELLLRDGQLDEAIRFLTAALVRRPDGLTVWYRLGIALRFAGRFDEAKAAYRQVMRIKPDYPKVHRSLGIALYKQGRVDEAIRAYKEAIRLDPKFASAWSNLGSALRKQGRVDEAIRAYKEAIELDPEYASPWYGLGHAERSMRRWNAAIAAYKRYVELRPNYAVGHNNLGVALKSKGDLDAAVEAFRTAFRIDPRYAEALKNLGVILISRGELDEAIAIFERVREIEPDVADAYLQLGIAFHTQKKWDAAIESYETAIRLEPSDAFSHRNLGYVFDALGKPEDAIPPLRAAIRLDPSLEAVRSCLGTALGSTGRHDEAAAVFRELTRRKPDDAEAHSNLAVSLRKLGRTDEAVAALRESARLKPKDPRVRTHLGAQLFDQGKVAAALAAHREALRLDPNLAEARVNLGVALRAKRDLDGARKAFREAARVAPDLYQAHFNLGSLEKEVGNFAAAVPALERALELRPKSRSPKKTLDECRRMAALAPRLSVLLRDFTKTPREDRIAMAKLCYARERYADSAKVWKLAFADDPTQLESESGVGSVDLWHAAVSAALAAETDVAWRRQSIAWLRARLDRMTRGLDSAAPSIRFKVMRILATWKRDPRLAAIRVPERWVEVTAAERRDIAKFWADVESLSSRVAHKSK